MDVLAPAPFAEAARRAFPPEAATAADQAVRLLSPVVNEGYRQPAESFLLGVHQIALPKRLDFKVLGRDEVRALPVAARCLVSRATDGHQRQVAVRSILGAEEPWVVPFVLAPLGEYVIEIIEDIAMALPRLDRALHADLVRQNPRALRLMRARATSYWNAFHRARYPNKADYPALRVLDELEAWAG
jgi:hypothetical protein